MLYVNWSPRKRGTRMRISERARPCIGHTWHVCWSVVSDLIKQKTDTRDMGGTPTYRSATPYVVALSVCLIAPEWHGHSTADTHRPRTLCLQSFCLSSFAACGCMWCTKERTDEPIMSQRCGVCCAQMTTPGARPAGRGMATAHSRAASRADSRATAPRRGRDPSSSPSTPSTQLPN